MYATADIYHAAHMLLEKATIPMNVKLMAITVYGLEPYDPEQLSIFDVEQGQYENKMCDEQCAMGKKFARCNGNGAG